MTYLLRIKGALNTITMIASFIMGILDQVPVTFDNLQATMISSTMYYKADAIHLVDVKQK